MKKYATLLFDVGGTLLRLNVPALAQVYVDHAGALGAPLDLARASAVIGALEAELPVWQQNRQVSLDLDDGKEFWNNFYAEGFRRLGIIRDVASAANQIRERFQRAEFEMLFDDVLPTIAALSARGIALGILSNFSANLENVLRQVGVHHYFDFFIVSAVAGVEKPDPRIFDLAARAANQARQAIVYIGDSPFHDIAGAQRAGLDAILVDRSNRYPNFDGVRVRDLRELALLDGVR